MRHNFAVFHDGFCHCFRYSPTESKRTFPVLGVTIVHQPHDECNRRHCSISLGQLNWYSTGVYKCEVSGDAPAFPVVYDSRNMTVYGRFLWSYAIDKQLT